MSGLTTPAWGASMCCACHVCRSCCAPTELEIPLAGGTSLVARAALEMQPLRAQGTQSGERLRGVDLEIGRLLQTEALTRRAIR